MLKRLSPIGFWSYARIDGEAAKGRLSGLRERLQTELQQQYGRDQVKIFQDLRAIAPGDDWERELRDAISDATYLIPVITPAFLESEWCCREVMMFVEQEARINAAHPELQDRKRIYPIHYIDIANADPCDPAVLPLLKTRQWLDFRDMRFSGDDDPAVQRQLAGLAANINELLQIKVDAPDAPVAAKLVTKSGDPATVARARAERLQQEEAAERRAAEAAAATLRPAAAAPEAVPTVPWYKKPLGIGGIVAGVVLVGAALYSAGDETTGGDGKSPATAASAARTDGDSVTAMLLALPADWTNGSAKDIAAEALKKTSIAGLLPLGAGGDARAQVLLGTIYSYGIGDGNEIDENKAIEWFGKAAAQDEPLAQLELANIYYDTNGGHLSYAEAFRWAGKAAAQGNAEAQFLVGNMYDLHLGTKADPAKAKQFYEMALAQPDALSAETLGLVRNNLATILLGEGTGSAAINRAIQMLTTSAAADNRLAMYNLGYLVYAADGVRPDAALARSWMTKAAAGPDGDADAKQWLKDNPA